MKIPKQVAERVRRAGGDAHVLGGLQAGAFLGAVQHLIRPELFQQVIQVQGIRLLDPNSLRPHLSA